MSIDWEPFRRIVRENARFLLTSHVRPDADALGSELALAALLRQQGRTVQIVNASPTPKRLGFLDPGQIIQQFGAGTPVEQLSQTDVLVIVDTSAWVQLGEMGQLIRRLNCRKVVIDHHVSSDDLGALEFKDTVAEATGALIYRLAEAMGWPVPPDVISPLFCALATDTGWFRFSSTTGDTLRIASKLIDAGAQPHLIYEKLYEQYSIGRIRLSGRALSRVKVECDGRLAHTYVRWDDYVETGSEPADTEDLVNECLRISGTQCAFIAIEQSNRQIKVSFRSRTDLNVAAIAEKFNGGGHKQAAGAILPGPIAEAQFRVLAALKEQLEC